MTISSIQTNAITTAWNGSSYDVTVSYTCPVDSKMLSIRFSGAYDNPASITYNGVAATYRLSAATGNHDRCHIWDLVLPTTGLNNLVIDTGGFARTYDLILCSVDNIDTTNPVGASNSLDAGSVAVTTAVDDLVLDVLVLETSIDALAVAGQTAQASSFGKVSASSKVATTTSTTMSWTYTSDWDAIAAQVYHTAATNSVDTIDTPVLDAEQNNAFTYSGFASGAPTSLTIGTAGAEFTSGNLLATASGGSGTFNMPDVASYSSATAGIPFDSASWGSKVVTVSNGTESATTTLVVDPKTNWHVVEVNTPITTQGSIFYVAGGWVFAAPANGDQVYYYSTEIVNDQAADYFVIAADGTITTNLLTGSVSFGFFDQTDGLWHPDSVEIGALSSIGSMGSSQNIRRLMRRGRPGYR